MTAPSAWVNNANAALLTDLYELTMLQAYLKEGLDQQAVFDLFVRRLPANRNYLIACGLDDVLRYLETLHFTAEALEYLASRQLFRLPFPMGYGGLPETQVVAAEGWNDAKGFDDLVDRRINTYAWLLMDDSFADHPLFKAVRQEYSRLWHEEYLDGDCGWCGSCEIT